MPSLYYIVDRKQVIPRYITTPNLKRSYLHKSKSKHPKQHEFTRINRHPRYMTEHSGATSIIELHIGVVEIIRIENIHRQLLSAISHFTLHNAIDVWRMNKNNIIARGK